MPRRLIAACLLALALAPAAQAAPKAGYVWRTMPTADQMGYAVPERALREEVEGRAMIRCTVLDNGTLNACAVVSETPEGYGFGEAALTLQRLFQLEMSAPGSPKAGEQVTLPIRFTF